MGVHGLWDLIAPVGRRVSVETLAGKRLAIDASIWMIQFMKAMRDEKGEMVRNAHILGFFRRICKLLYLRTKPVFVFDGGTPALKRRTVIARRRQRDNAQAKIRKTAEKLLLSRVKEMRLKELADDLQKQRQENDIKGKRPISQESISVRSTEKENDNRHANSSQEQLDEMLAASLAAEENEDFAFNASTSRPAVPDGVSIDGEEDEEDEEMILPEMHGKVDPAILAALPPSLQLDLLVQMRERLMAENRQKYQKVKKAPSSFSELQIEAYLKTVAFRREIDVVQKAAAGGGISGVQTSRIASEANREFIFSSSFTGDKQALTSVERERVGADQSQAPPLNISTEPVKKDMKTRSSDSVAGLTDAETGKEFPDDIETYRDERGHLRVSKVRALGIRMTRDLQRNLDMMKEIEHRGVEVDLEKNSESTTAGTLVDIHENSCDRRQHPEITDNNNFGMIHKVEKRMEPAASNPTSIKISFADVAEHDELENDDDKLFACLVDGNPVIDFSFDNSTSRIQSLHSDSDVEWEGDIEKTDTKMLETRSSHSDSDVEWEEGSSIEKKVTNKFKVGMSSEGKVEGEEGFQGIQRPFSCSDSIKRTLTKGSLQEEADLQEAIRRSLMDKGGHESVNNFGEDHVSEGSQSMIFDHAGSVFSYQGKEKPEVMASATNVCQPGGTRNTLETNRLESNSSAFITLNPDKNNLDLKISNQDGGTSEALTGQVFDTSDVQHGTEICSENGNDRAGSEQVGDFDSEMTLNCPESGYSMSFNDSVHDRFVDSDFAEAKEKPHGASNDSSFDVTNLGNISPDGMFTDADGVKELLKNEIHGDSVVGKEGPLKNSFVGHHIEYENMKGHLDEEMLFLGKEQEDLEIEQRKLERNAESVSSEMFMECQELLQMFGLPYIIAPMEAEAQCAFMEMSNLVDGVVTDDSDAFLFGAQCVYKNIFDDRKYVETYLMKDIANDLGLDREKLIHMALLLGSDYTEGVSGIGIVNAIEVVNAFPEKDGLCEFRAWIESPDPSILGNIDAKSRHNRKGKGSKGGEDNTGSSKIGGNSCDQNVAKPVDDTQRIKQVFMDKHRNVSKNWHIPTNFPSDAVISAYDSPQVDKSTEPFAWGKPDLHVLRKLCWEKFAWGTAKANELLLPVLKEYNKHETQLRLEAFYSFNERFAKIRSKRIKKAVKGMVGANSSGLIDEERPQQAGSGRKRKPKHNEDGVGSTELDGAGASDPNDVMEQLTVKKTRVGRAPQKNLEPPIEVSGHPDPRKGVHVRGRQRGKGRGQLTGRGSRKRKSCSVDYENEESSSRRDQEMQSERTEESHLVRRSRKLRKTVSYKVSDESDGSDKDNESCPEVGLTVESFVSKAENEAIGSGDVTLDANELIACNDHGVGTRPIVDETENVHGTDTTPISQIDNQIHDPLNQTESSKDYLQFGGGFCMEEDDEQAQLDQPVLDPATGEMITQKSDIPKSAVPEILEIDQREIGPGPSRGETYVSYTEPNMNNTGSNDHPLDDFDSDSGNHNRILLRAMPNLRKKRRT